MSTLIYTSEKVMPYVYMGTHRTSGEFYIGYRSANKTPSSYDLGTHYFTSSKHVKKLGFENFDWQIIAEFLNGKFAYDFEQELIGQHFKDRLNLNRFHDKTGKYYTLGKNPYADRTEDLNLATSEKMSESQKKRFQKQTLEEKSITNNKRSNSMLNRSEEEKAITKQLRIQFRQNQTKEEKERYSKNLSNSLQNRSEEEKTASIQKRIETILNRPEEVKQQIAKKKVDTWNNRTEEEKLQSKLKQRETLANRSEEEKALTAKLMAERNQKLTFEQRNEFVNLRDNGMSYKDLLAWVLSLGIKFTIDGIRKLYHREMKLRLKK